MSWVDRGKLSSIVVVVVVIIVIHLHNEQEMCLVWSIVYLFYSEDTNKKLTTSFPLVRVAAARDGLPPPPAGANVICVCVCVAVALGLLALEDDAAAFFAGAFFFVVVVGWLLCSINKKIRSERGER